MSPEALVSALFYVTALGVLAVVVAWLLGLFAAMHREPGAWTMRFFVAALILAGVGFVVAFIGGLLLLVSVIVGVGGML